ncbi:MAG: VTT domain-containing protein [Acidobacteriota bacterium]|nr:VTT domain-containing protein [Blastocatellia bacterium]MDW8411559.1 VTT domain-containing protein [Acidobacteriota bacterium]
MIAKLRSWTRKLYAQTQKWGQSERCLRDLLLISIASSTIIPLPTEAFLMAIILAAPHRWWRAAAVGTLGSTFGAVFWYLLGRYLLSKALLLLELIAPESNLEQIKAVVSKRGIIYLSVAAFTPGLFRVGMVAAGVMELNLLYCMAAIVSGRGSRFMLEAVVIRIFGRRVVPFLEKYFDFIALGIGLLIILLVLMTRINRAT